MCPFSPTKLIQEPLKVNYGKEKANEDQTPPIVDGPSK
jgi:hypothetical protein